MLEITKRKGEFLKVRASGWLTAEDYETLMPQLEGAIETQGKLRLLIELDDLKGFKPMGLVEELKFNVKHASDFEKIAVVGQSRLAAVATRVTEPFFSGQARYFDREQAFDAEAWVLHQ